jgi:hypothetical protein
MLKYEFYHYVILKFALEAGGRDPLERSTIWGGLANVIREAGLSEDGLEHALIQLSDRKVLVLKKVEPWPPGGALGYDAFDYPEYRSKDQFFWGNFGLHVTSEGTMYFDRLGSKIPPPSAPPTPSKPQIGFRP